MEVTRYEDSGIAPEILKAVAEMGFENMTPIQEQAIPVLLTGKDMIGQAQTGTGKTAAFGIPLIQSIDVRNRSLQALVLCPTRELAMQAADEIRRFAKYMHGIRVLPIYGGQEIYKQIKALKGGVQIIVGTPGRVMDHMRRHTIKTDQVKMVVLDEADEMLNMGFREDMETILKEIPAERQTALFSATMPQAILDITGTYQKENVVMVKIVKEELTIPLVEQNYYLVRNQYKEEVAARLLEYHNVKRALIFCNTKKMVDELAENLSNRGFFSAGLHGDMSQHQRDVVMNRFRNGNLEILIATDVAARGIDVDDVEAVINYDIPQDIEYYVHRIGRTGRAGKTGKAFTLVSGRDMYRIREIERTCKTKMQEQSIPSAGALTSIKAKKIMDKAWEVLESGVELDKLRFILTVAAEEGEYSELDIAAALLRMQMGEEAKEIANLADYSRGDKNGKNAKNSKNKKSGYPDKGRNGDKRKSGDRPRPADKYKGGDKKPYDKLFKLEKGAKDKARSAKSGSGKSFKSKPEQKQGRDFMYEPVKKKERSDFSAEKSSGQAGTSGFRRERSATGTFAE